MKTLEGTAGDSPPLKSLPLKLVVLVGPDEGRELAVDGPVDVGSDPAAHLPLTDATVSRRHVSIAPSGAKVRVRDLGSRNGTFLGSTRVTDAEVPVGSVLKLGRTELAVQPRWQVREVPASTATAFGEVIGGARAMRELFAILERVSDTDLTVLIEGESGTGKELVARAIHGASSRRTWPYVVFDCGSVPRELAESELFGHKKGAFSGAISTRAGAFASAHGGTLFLDELGELPIELQPKLLRVLESGEVRAVGDDTIRKVDVRVVAATNRDLHAEVARGNFRADLLYRLEVVRVRLPPLRARPEDVPRLIERLLSGRIDANEPITGENLAKLVAYSWPGNVRELRNVLTRAAALAKKGALLPKFSELVFNLGPLEKEPATIGAELPGVATARPYKEAKAALLQRFDEAYVSALMARHGRKMTEAAKAAGISRKHLYELIRRVTGEDTALEGVEAGDDGSDDLPADDEPGNE